MEEKTAPSKTGMKGGGLLLFVTSVTCCLSPLSHVVCHLCRVLFVPSVACCLSPLSHVVCHLCHVLFVTSVTCCHLCHMLFVTSAVCCLSPLSRVVCHLCHMLFVTSVTHSNTRGKCCGLGVTNTDNNWRKKSCDWRKV